MFLVFKCFSRSSLFDYYTYLPATIENGGACIPPRMDTPPLKNPQLQIKDFSSQSAINKLQARLRRAFRNLGLAGERKAHLKNYADLASTAQETQGMPRISNNSNNSNSNSYINGYSNNSNSSSN